MPMKVGDVYQWSIDKGECLYIADSQDGRKHSMMTVGYEGVLIRHGDDKQAAAPAVKGVK
jgi:hypothetical protein